jgi:hypothetical protein
MLIVMGFLVEIILSESGACAEPQSTLQGDS